MKKTLNNFLEKHNACRSGFEFAKDLNLEQFLQTCKRGDWILWLFKKTNPDHLRELTLAKALCSNTVRHLITDSRSRKAVDVAIEFGNNRATREELDNAIAGAASAYNAAIAIAGAAASAYNAAASAYNAANAAAAASAAASAYNAASAAASAYNAANAANAAASAANAAASAYNAANAAANAAASAYNAANANAYYADAASAAASASAYNSDAYDATSYTKNQICTADICRKYLPIEIWDQSKL